MIREINPSIAPLVESNGGYCPCAIEQNEDTKCPCREFRETESGICHCGRYEKTEMTYKEEAEKQIPKKPLTYADYFDHLYSSCPACGAEKQEPLPFGVAYCSRCGQKIDWSE